MSETNETIQKSELEVLKERATQLGLKFGPNIGVDLLRARVNAVLNGDADLSDVDEEEFEEEETKEVVSVKPKLDKKLAEKFGETPQEKRERLRKEAFKLVRVRIQCMNPLKKSLQGEVFTVSNSIIGTYRKFVPYNIESEEGWMVPQIMLNMLRERQFNNVRYERKNGVNVPKANLVKEFAIEVLPQLTQKELTEMARRQAMAKSVD